MFTTLHRGLTALLAGLKDIVSPSVCRHCHGSGVDQGMAMGEYFCIPCSFCDAGIQEDARRVQQEPVVLP